MRRAFPQSKSQLRLDNQNVIRRKKVSQRRRGRCKLFVGMSRSVCLWLGNSTGDLRDVPVFGLLWAAKTDSVSQDGYRTLYLTPTRQCQGEM